MKSPPSVLVLDSGIGGLSITKEIRALYPSLHIDYLADLAGFPYGTKSGDEIVQRVLRIMDHAVRLLNPQLVVIACNTASTVALEPARSKFSIPIVGVVPAIKPAAALTESGVVGLLATEGTVNRSYTHNLIKEFAGHRKVFLHGSARLVDIAETKFRYGTCDLNDVEREVLPLIHCSKEMDTVVLACTHFPLLKAELAEAFPQIRFWVDSGAAIARRVVHLLDNNEKKETSLGTDVNTNTTAATLSPSPRNYFFTTAYAPLQYQAPALQLLLGDFEARAFGI